ncbi:MAG: DUF2157 domain-containing protein [Isosphaeraceae bacterium]
MNREITESQRAWLKVELESWRGLGLVSDDQALAVLSLYGTEAQAAERRQSRALAILLFLSALLAGLGVLLLIGYNWAAMPSAAKVVLILAAVITAHSAGLKLRSQKEKATASEVAFFLGCLLFGAGIGLIGQIFHVNANDAGAFWWWAIGVLPFALALEGIAFHVLFVALAATWCGYEVLGFGNLGAWFFGRWGGIPNGAYSLLALAAPGFALAYKRKSAPLLSLYVPLIAWWVVLQPFAWRFHENPAYFIGSVGGLLLLAAELHRAGDPMAVPYRFHGTALVGGLLIPMSFSEFHRFGWGAGTDLIPMLVEPVVVAALALILLAVAVGLRRRGEPGGSWNEDWLAVVRTATTPLGLIGMFVAMGLWRLVTGGEPIAPTIAANLAMLALAFWLMRLGLRDDRGLPFSVGVGYFLLWTMLRYFDLFGDFGGMLGAALMFFLCGAALFGVALYWRRRKEVTLA